MATDTVSEGTPLGIAKAIHETAKGLYWKEKDLVSAKAMLTRGIAFAKTQAAKAGDEASSADLLGMAKAMSFDLASFCWPGWGEEGIEIHEADVLDGEAAAEENLRLAVELKRGDGPMGNAHFMVGAYRLSRARFDEAVESFTAFRDRAVQGGDASSALLAEGYLAITRILENEEASEEEFRAIERRLREEGVENGTFFADQLVTALTVLREAE